MPQLSTSEAVKNRIEVLIERLVAYANGELTDCNHLRDKLIVRWTDEESETPKLIVKTELRFLAELVFNQQGKKVKEHIKHDLHVLQKFLPILEDNRTKTQGSASWHFTLKLWRKSTETNLRVLQREWERCKSNRSQLQISSLKPNPKRNHPIIKQCLGMSSGLIDNSIHPHSHIQYQA